MSQQAIIALTMLLKPIGLVLLLLAAYPFKRMAMRMKDSKLKRLLLYRLN